MLCTCPVRSVGSLSRTCFRDFRFISDVQVFTLHWLPRGRRTHGERISAKIDATVGYGQRGQPVPVVVPITVVASRYLPRWVLYLFTAYGTLWGGPPWIHIYCLHWRFIYVYGGYLISLYQIQKFNKTFPVKLWWLYPVRWIIIFVGRSPLKYEVLENSWRM